MEEGQKGTAKIDGFLTKYYTNSTGFPQQNAGFCGEFRGKKGGKTKADRKIFGDIVQDPPMEFYKGGRVIFTFYP